jgi:hypothetical protein
MTWPDVEFLDPAGLPLVDEPDPPPPPQRVPSKALITSALPLIGWLAAGVLAVLASFRLAYYASFVNPGQPTVRISVDGWGREQYPDNAPTFGEHGTRLGIVFSAALGLIAVLVVLAIWRVWRGSARGWPDRTMAALAVVVPSILATVTATQWLMIDGVRSSYRAINRQNAISESAVNGSNGSPSPIAPSTIHIHVGPSVWLALAAVVFATIASATYLLSRRPSAPESTLPKLDTGEPEASPQDDVNSEADVHFDDAELLA